MKEFKKLQFAARAFKRAMHDYQELETNYAIEERALTQKQNVRLYLLAGHEISSLEALKKFGAFRLSDIIYRLKKEGMNIEKRTQIVGNKHFAVYSLKK